MSPEPLIPGLPNNPGPHFWLPQELWSLETHAASPESPSSLLCMCHIGPLKPQPGAATYPEQLRFTHVSRQNYFCDLRTTPLFSSKSSLLSKIPPPHDERWLLVVFGHFQTGIPFHRTTYARKVPPCPVSFLEESKAWASEKSTTGGGRWGPRLLRPRPHLVTRKKRITMYPLSCHNAFAAVIMQQ